VSRVQLNVQGAAAQRRNLHIRGVGSRGRALLPSPISVARYRRSPRSKRCLIQPISHALTSSSLTWSIRVSNWPIEPATALNLHGSQRPKLPFVPGTLPGGAVHDLRHVLQADLLDRPPPSRRSPRPAPDSGRPSRRRTSRSAVSRYDCRESPADHARRPAVRADVLLDVGHDCLQDHRCPNGAPTGDKFSSDND
jgi:hypothetical protein